VSWHWGRTINNAISSNKNFKKLASVLGQDKLKIYLAFSFFGRMSYDVNVFGPTVATWLPSKHAPM